MDPAAAMAEINWLIVLLAAVVPFVLGALWYGPLFGKMWMAASGMTEEKAAQGNMGKIFGVAFVLQILQSAVFAMFIGPDAGLSFGLMAGLMAGVAWVATAIGVVYLFEQRSFAHWFTNAGYAIVSFTVMGAILGAWA